MRAKWQPLKAMWGKGIFVLGCKRGEHIWLLMAKILREMKKADGEQGWGSGSMAEQGRRAFAYKQGVDLG